VARYERTVDADGAKWCRAESKQDFGAPRSAEPTVQGDVHVPSRAVSAARRLANGRGVCPAKLEEKGHDWVVHIR